MCKHSREDMQVSRKGNLHVHVLQCGHVLVCSSEYASYEVPLPTFKYGTDLPDPCCPLSVILSQSQLHVEERHACYHHEEQVWHQERTYTHAHTQTHTRTHR